LVRNIDRRAHHLICIYSGKIEKNNIDDERPLSRVKMIRCEGNLKEPLRQPEIILFSFFSFITMASSHTNVKKSKVKILKGSVRVKN
jgi:hypothetical protein